MCGSRTLDSPPLNFDTVGGLGHLDSGFGIFGFSLLPEEASVDFGCRILAPCRNTSSESPIQTLNSGSWDFGCPLEPQGPMHGFRILDPRSLGIWPKG